MKFQLETGRSAGEFHGRLSAVLEDWQDARVGIDEADARRVLHAAEGREWFALSAEGGCGELARSAGKLPLPVGEAAVMLLVTGSENALLTEMEQLVSAAYRAFGWDAELLFGVRFGGERGVLSGCCRVEAYGSLAGTMAGG